MIINNKVTFIEALERSNAEVVLKELLTELHGAQEADLKYESYGLVSREQLARIYCMRARGAARRRDTTVTGGQQACEDLQATRFDSIRGHLISFAHHSYIAFSDEATEFVVAVIRSNKGGFEDPPVQPVS